MQTFPVAVLKIRYECQSRTEGSNPELRKRFCTEISIQTLNDNVDFLESTAIDEILVSKLAFLTKEHAKSTNTIWAMSW